VGFRGGFLEMDPPEQRHYRQLLNPYLSPAAVARWTPLVDEIVRASLNEKIESGRIDFVDDLANIAPAVLTLAMLGVPLRNWDIYVEPVHVVQGMKHLPATFTPGPRIGDGLAETIDRMQVVVNEQGLAAPVTARKGAAALAGNGESGR
jgi:cytochrome P450